MDLAITDVMANDAQPAKRMLDLCSSIQHSHLGVRTPANRATLRLKTWRTMHSVGKQQAPFVGLNGLGPGLVEGNQPSYGAARDPFVGAQDRS